MKNSKDISWFCILYIWIFLTDFLKNALGKISSLPDMYNFLWLIIRNLNELSNSNKKSSKYKGNSTRYDKFNKLINNNRLIDLLGVAFTWYNKREASNATFARLNRALANVHRLKLYPSAVSNFPINVSNYPHVLLKPSIRMHHIDIETLSLSKMAFEDSIFNLVLIYGCVLLKVLMLITN